MNLAKGLSDRNSTVAIALIITLTLSPASNGEAGRKTGGGAGPPHGTGRGMNTPSGPPPQPVKSTPDVSPGQLNDAARTIRGGIDDAKKAGDHRAADTLGAKARQAETTASTLKRNLDDMRVQARKAKLEPYDKVKAQLRVDHVVEKGRLPDFQRKLGVTDKASLARKLDEIEAKPDLFIRDGHRTISGKYVDKKSGVVTIRNPNDQRNGGTAFYTNTFENQMNNWYEKSIQ